MDWPNIKNENSLTPSTRRPLIQPVSIASKETSRPPYFWEPQPATPTFTFEELNIDQQNQAYGNHYNPYQEKQEYCIITISRCNNKSDYQQAEHTDFQKAKGET